MNFKTTGARNDNEQNAAGLWLQIRTRRRRNVTSLCERHREKADLKEDDPVTDPL